MKGKSNSFLFSIIHAFILPAPAPIREPITPLRETAKPPGWYCLASLMAVYRLPRNVNHFRPNIYPISNLTKTLYPFSKQECMAYTRIKFHYLFWLFNCSLFSLKRLISSPQDAAARLLLGAIVSLILHHKIILTQNCLTYYMILLTITHPPHGKSPEGVLHGVFK